MRYVMLFFRMARPKQIMLIVLIYIWGGLMASAQGFAWDASSFLFGLSSAILISISIHYANEYADYQTDALTQRTLYSGGSGALQDLGLDRRLAIKGAVLFVFAGFLLAIIATRRGHLSTWILAPLGAAAFLGWEYSLRPLKLAWRGWGEIDNALLGGFLLPVYGYAAISHRVETPVVSASLPFAMLAFVNLLGTHWADREADQAVGKNTLTTKLSVSRLRLIYLLPLLGAYTGIVLLPGIPLPVRIASFSVLPLSLWGYSRFTRQHSPAPSVYPMVAYLFIQVITWGFIFF